MAELPPIFKRLQRDYPKLLKAYERFGRACFMAGPLDRKTAELVKLAFAIGSGLEGGAHSHARRALEAGATPEELRHVALLGFTTIGFPAGMAGLSWIEDLARRKRKGR